MFTRSMVACIVCVALQTRSSFGQIVIDYDGGSEGLDGTFSFVADPGNANQMTIDLGLAPTCGWNNDGCASHGTGVYDPDKWAVVFKYSGDVMIPAGKTVRFKNNLTRAPVAWLVQGNVTVHGTVDLTGANGHSYDAPQSLAKPGPGGFRGGQGENNVSEGCAGLGPGGATYSIGPDYFRGGAGSYATHGQAYPESPALGNLYGNPIILPLVGGSGGAGGRSIDTIVHGGGGAGGGAISIVATGMVEVATTGKILARGGAEGDWQHGNYRSGSGSGGAIRIVANQITNSGTMSATEGRHQSSGTGIGGKGRIRLEANLPIVLNTQPEPSETLSELSPLSVPVLVWPAADAPVVRVTAIEVNGKLMDVSAFLADPKASFDTGAVDLTLDTENPVVFHIESRYVQDNWGVALRLAARSGDSWQTDAKTPLAPCSYAPGDPTLLCTTVETNVPRGTNALQAIAWAP